MNKEATEEELSFLKENGTSEDWGVSNSCTVGTNHLIILEILGNFGTYDLKMLRFINRRWNDLVTSHLLRHGKLQISVDNGDERSNLFRQLALCMENTLRFPCASFNFRAMHSLEFMIGLRGFLNTWGVAVNDLRLNCITSFQDLKAIMMKTPNLESLTIVYLDVQTVNPSEKPLSTKLKSIQVHFVEQSSMNQQVFMYILKSSPFLKKIQDFQIDHLNLVKEVDKLHLIETLKFDPDLETLGLYKTFASLRINLTELNISMITANVNDTETNFASQIGTILTAILHVSANSLRKLKMLPLSGLDIQFPVLPNLKHISFRENDAYIREYSPQGRVNSEEVFPAGFDFSTHFPRIVSICFAGIGDRDIAAFLPEVKVNPIQAQVLQIITRVTPGELCILTTKLSLITTLDLQNTSLDMSQVNLWSLIPNNVYKLRLYDSTFFVPFPVESNRLGLLDSYFLKNTEEPSFPDLQNLKSLDFTFDLLNSYQNRTWFTPLTGQYAFAAIESLRVTFHYDMESANAAFLQCTLKPMYPFVNFSHWKYRESDNEY